MARRSRIRALGDTLGAAAYSSASSASAAYSSASSASAAYFSASSASAA